VSYAWIFPNVVTSGHWWYSNVPAYITSDLRARLQAVRRRSSSATTATRTSWSSCCRNIGTYRRVLAKVLADDFVREGVLSETGAVELARFVLRDNVKRIFNV